MNSFSRFDGWMRRSALPLWLGAGVEREGPFRGRFHERLGFDGVPDVRANRRTRVQARQLFVACAAAARQAHPEARDLASACLDQMIAHHHAGAGRWLFSTDAKGRPAGAGPDLYDHAFVLFALGHGARVLGRADALALAHQTQNFLDEAMASASGGWHESLPPALPRRQNPHMHLFEAYLALMAASDEGTDARKRWRSLARQVIALLNTRLFDAGHGVLREFFEDDWRARPPPEGDIIEPGHHFEWVWLLHQAKAAGLEVDGAIAGRLYASACDSGTDGQGRVLDAINPAHRVTDRGRRLWGQCEAVKAHLVRGQRERAERTLAALMASHLDTDVPGLWCDHFYEDGSCRDGFVPASSLYHLAMMWDEIEKAAP